ncbi:hypothetical protein KP509_27G069100 [Ceratopteris richardii]|uniref:Uncharacterized protein n=1 Tax=Ceratopteris richardii TaxID=49495 RepID=A0A8T2RHK8_CERRI|nr:hypothetical protein KP509_27G069100 [Ceratopteris richardii]
MNKKSDDVKSELGDLWMLSHSSYICSIYPLKRVRVSGMLFLLKGSSWLCGFRFL